MADDFLSDDDIIDLTELIEKGKDPADSLTPLVEEGPAEEGSDKGAITDLDALLAEIDAKENPRQEEITPEQARSPEHKVDPQEQLDMGGMDRVDALLDNLDIPPQPGPLAAAKAAAPAAELDNAVDALLNSAAPADVAAPSDLDKDLDAILADVPSPGAGDDAPSAEQLANPSAGLDALLAGFSAPAEETPAAPEPEPAPAAPAANPIADIDALLDSVAPSTAAAEPAPEPAPMPEAAASAIDDLDAMLTAAAAAPTPEPAAPAADLTADLDAMLAAAAAPVPEPEATAPAVDDLDAMLATAAEPVTESAPAPEAANAAMDDLDAMMAAAAAETAPAPPTPLKRTPRITLDPIPKPIGGAPMPNLAPVAEPQAPVADDLDAMLATAAEPAPEPASSVADPATDLNAMMTAATPEPAAEAPAGAMSDVAPAMLAMEMPAEGPLPDVMPEMPVAEPLQETMSDVSEPAPAAHHQGGASFEEVLDENSPLHDRFAGLIASAVATALQNNAAILAAQVTAAAAPPPVPDMPDMDGLNERMDAIESRLERLAASIGQLASAQAEAEANAAADDSADATLARLQDMELANKSLAARMDSLEQRLDALEPRFNAEVEKAAAAAAARILREEIANLLAS